jgi:NAD-dependent deacetylase
MSDNITTAVPDSLIENLRRARSVTVLTGAGISAESGIPTFRESQTGIWAQYNPQDLATPQAFDNNPRLVMDWYRWRLKMIESAQPNPGHYALAAMEKQIASFTLVTQNVDGLHARAGSTNLIELHGSIRRLRCFDNECSYIVTGWPPEDLPRCPECGALLRPDVVWFGEMLPIYNLETAARASRACDLFFSVGTSGVVEPAASLPYEALRGGAAVVEINPQPTPLSVHTRYYFPQPSGQILPQIVAASWPDPAP